VPGARLTASSPPLRPPSAFRIPPFQSKLIYDRLPPLDRRLALPMHPFCLIPSLSVQLPSAARMPLLSPANPFPDLPTVRPALMFFGQPKFAQPPFGPFIPASRSAQFSTESPCLFLRPRTIDICHFLAVFSEDPLTEGAPFFPRKRRCTPPPREDFAPS